jgi:hypothetical protein
MTSAVTTDGNWLLAYAPVLEQGARTFTVDMSALAGTARARWFDPATGNYIAAGDGFANTGTRDFTTPGKREDGTDDWLLVLDTTDQSSCGSITTTGTYHAPSSSVPGVTCDVTATSADSPGVIARTPVVTAGG